MNVSAIMRQNPVVVASDDSMSLAIRRMKEGNFKHLPVVDKGGALAGVISDRDLKRASPSDATLLEVHELLYLMERVKVSQVMTKKPITATPDATLQAAAGLLVKHKIGCLPIVDGAKLVGIVTQTDFLNHIAQSAN